MHWVPVEAFPAPNAPAVAGVEDANKDADGVASEATFMSGTTVFGDSTYTDDKEANGGAGPGAAVAAEGPDAPRELAHRREGQAAQRHSAQARCRSGGRQVERAQ